MEQRSRISVETEKETEPKLQKKFYNVFLQVPSAFLCCRSTKLPQALKLAVLEQNSRSFPF